MVPATSGQDVRLIEAITATGRRVAGLAGGQRYAAASPQDPLMRRAHAAIDELEERIDSLESRARKLSREKADQPEKQRLTEEAGQTRPKGETDRQGAAT